MGQVFVGGALGQLFFGGPGVNTLDYSASPGAVVVDLVHNFAQNGFGATDFPYNIQIVLGSTHGSTFTGASGNETFVVEGGNNAISGTLPTLLEFHPPTGNADPFSMVVGPDGRSIWFTEFNTDKIGHVSFGSQVTISEPISTPANPPNQPGNLGGLAFDPNGNIWFTEIATDKIGVASPAGVLLHEFPISTG